MNFSKKVQSMLPYIGFAGVILVGLLLVKSILFPSKDLMTGVILEKLYVPSQFVAGPNVLSFNRYRSNDYVITTQSNEQWIALVSTSEGKVLVHCNADHFKMKEVGDVLHFKKYTGEVLGIEYQSHYEEIEEGLSFFSIIKKIG